MQWVNLLAQTQTLGGDPVNNYLTPLISLGGFGLLLILLLTGRVVTKSAFDEMRSDRDAYKAAAELATQTLAKNQATMDKLTDQGDVDSRLLTEIKAQAEE